MNAITLAILGYVALQLLVGAWVSRRVRTEEDYLVAGRRLGFPLATFTIFATWFGAETCIGAAGSIYEKGLSGGSADPFGYMLCLVLMGLVFAVPLWKLRLTTVADFFRGRFSAAVERLVVLLMVPASLLWGAAQIRAFGQVLAASSGLDVGLTISVAAGVVILYTMSGGLLADAWTDVLQGIALMIGLVVLFVVVTMQNGISIYTTIEPERLRLFDHGATSFLETVEAWAIPVLGSAVAAELVARIIASRSPRVAQRATLTAAGVYLAIGLIPVSLGLVGAKLVPGLEHPEQLLPQLAQRSLPTLLYAVFAGALVSAILSTVDSTLLVAASLVSHNIVVPLRPGMTERDKVRVARAGVAIFGVLAYVMALHAEGVYALVEEASAFGSAGIFVVTALGLFTRFGRARSALAALVSGVATWVLGAYVLDFVHPYLVSLAAALGAYGLFAILEPRSRNPKLPHSGTRVDVLSREQRASEGAM